MSAFLLAIDQGTTSTRAIVYDELGNARGVGQRELTQYYPQPGWVEHDADEIWESVASVVSAALVRAGVSSKQLTAIGLTNQRETVVLWERGTGKPIGRALVWQDRRTTAFCRQHAREQPWLSEQTGLVLDPYFSATKIRWLLDQSSDLRQAAEAGRLACGTIDSFLLWRLTSGRVHATDVTNASRTLLFHLTQRCWSDDLCAFFQVPRALLPEVKPSAGLFGTTAGLDFLVDGVPILGVAGDQQAALVGQTCFEPGEAKCTFGTGAFFLMHTGNRPAWSQHQLLTTLAASLDATPAYALEGSVFIAGAAVQWLRDGLKLVTHSAETQSFAEHSDPAEPILFVPGLTGLGAPYWVPEARGAIFGLTRATTAADFARAALEGVAYQVADLIESAANDSGQPLKELRVDGGMSANAWFLQRQADILGLPVLQPRVLESTARGAAFLAGAAAGVWPDPASLRRLNEADATFVPQWSSELRSVKLRTWRKAVDAVIRFTQ